MGPSNGRNTATTLFVFSLLAGQALAAPRFGCEQRQEGCKRCVKNQKLGCHWDGNACGSSCPAEYKFCHTTKKECKTKEDPPKKDTETSTPAEVVCTEQYEPVCGSDGKTYGNSCGADRAGVKVAAKGECKKGEDVDCSDTMCPAIVIQCEKGFAVGVADGECCETCKKVENTKTCTNGKDTVKIGWKGKGAEENWCNSCECGENGPHGEHGLRCTEMACSGTDPNLKTLCSAEGGTLACGAGCFRPCPAGQMCPAVMHYCQGDGSCGMNSEPKCEPEIACVQCPIHDAAPHMECTVTRKTTCDQCGAMECTSKCTDDEEYNWLKHECQKKTNPTTREPTTVPTYPQTHDPICGGALGNLCPTEAPICVNYKCTAAATTTPPPTTGTKEACMCSKEYDPVCGVDGITYGNACEAKCAKVHFIGGRSCEDKPECLICPMMAMVPWMTCKTIVKQTCTQCAEWQCKNICADDEEYIYDGTCKKNTKTTPAVPETVVSVTTVPEPTDEPPTCCLAMIAQCMACAAGTSVREFCEATKTADVVGCKPPLQDEGEACGHGFNNLPFGFFGDCKDGLDCKCVGSCADRFIADAPNTCVKSDSTPKTTTAEPQTECLVCPMMAMAPVAGVTCNTTVKQTCTRCAEWKCFNICADNEKFDTTTNKCSPLILIPATTKPCPPVITKGSVSQPMDTLDAGCTKPGTKKSNCRYETKTIQLCFEICKATAGCVSVNWWNNNKRCHLVGEGAVAERAKGRIRTMHVPTTC